MKYWNITSWHVIAILALLSFGYVAHVIWGDNNPIEEITEEVLKDTAGIDVDFSKI